MHADPVVAVHAAIHGATVDTVGHMTHTDMQSGPNELELDGDTFRALVDAALERLTPLLDGMAGAPASWPGGAAVAAGGQPAEGGAPVSVVLDELFGRLESGINTAAPGFMGYIPGGGVPHVAVADLIADVINRYVGISQPAPQLAAVEREVVRWFVSVLGLPAHAGGTFTSGGSAANLIAVAAAREHHFAATAAVDAVRGTIYVSDQAHHSVLKAARFAGVRRDQVRVIPSDDTFRVKPDVLRDVMRTDAAAGRRPFLVVGNAGTTNTGAVDDLAELADTAAEHGAWLHVDAAYGGFFALTVRGRAALAGIERADSVTLDPHKTLFLPYGTGALLVREPQRVASLFAATAEYLPPRADEDVEPAELGFELTRPFRGLRVWLPLRLHGTAVFTRLLDEKLDLAHRLHAELAAMQHVEVVAAPQLSTLAFAARRHAGEALDDVNARSVALLEHVNRTRRVLVTGTVLRGRFVIRPSIVSFRTHAEQVGLLAELVRSGAVSG